MLKVGLMMRISPPRALYLSRRPSSPPPCCQQRSYQSSFPAGAPQSISSGIGPAYPSISADRVCSLSGLKIMQSPSIVRLNVSPIFIPRRSQKPFGIRTPWLFPHFLSVLVAIFILMVMTCTSILSLLKEGFKRCSWSCAWFAIEYFTEHVVEQRFGCQVSGCIYTASSTRRPSGLIVGSTVSSVRAGALVGVAVEDRME